MSVEGLRAWIGEVERKLAKRTRVFVALTVIAIGIAAASLYLAIDYRNDSVGESDVRALQEKLETRIDEVAAGGATAVPTGPPVETEPEPAPQPEGSKPKQQGGKSQQESEGGGGASGTSQGGATGGAQSQGASGGAPSSARLQQLFEQAKKKTEEAEAGQVAP